MKQLRYSAVVFLAALVFSGAGLVLNAKIKKPPKTGDKAKIEKVEVVLYLMSKCPYGIKVQKAFPPVLDKLGAFIDFRQEYIVEVKPDGTFKSLHGEGEVKGDIAQLCLQKYYPEKYAFMGAVVCMNETPGKVPGAWKDCASKQGMDPSKLQPCIEGEEGKKLLAESAARSKMAGATACPTMYIGGEQYKSGRETADFENAVCCAIKKSGRPDVCPKDLTCPVNMPMDLVVLSDKRCQDCQTKVDAMLKSFKDKFPKLKLKLLDYSTSKGKKLYKKAGLKFLPAYLFPLALEKDVNYPTLEKWVSIAGGYYVMATGSKFDPTKEICDNGIDDTKNGRIDCLDEDCAGTLLCRERLPNMIDIFVMSQCPYGINALGSMKQVLQNFKGRLGFGLHYLVEVVTADELAKLGEFKKAGCFVREDGMYYCSLHGEAELNEDLRQLCAQKYYPKGYKFMDYVWCRSKDIKNPDWKPCAAEAKLDAAAIETCAATKEGLDLLKADAGLAKNVGFTGSPSFLFNNKQSVLLKDRSPEGIKKEICSHNPNLEGCKNTLAGPPPPATGAPGASKGK